MTAEGSRGSGRGRVVVSSVTGRPLAWDGSASPRSRRGEEAPILPVRLRDEGPEPGVDESNDARLARDVPPHWGSGS